jgi:hypothetical protein
MFYNKGMIRLFFMTFFVFLVSFPFLQGQELATAPEEGTEAELTENLPSPFPLSQLLTIALRKSVSWAPDWELRIPPDAFRVNGSQPSSITLLIGEEKYRTLWDRRGALIEFPFLLNGSFAQVKVTLNSSGVISRFNITERIETEVKVEREYSEYEGLYEDYAVNGIETEIIWVERLWQVDFIERDFARARITQDETTFFAALRYNPLHSSETWFDAEGTMLTHFTFRSQYSDGKLNLLEFVSRSEEGEEEEWYHYNSFGLVSEIESPQGLFRASYSGERHPRYWRQHTEDLQNNYYLQWDLRGFLNRMVYEENSSESAYEYTVDNRGNWVERRETIMIPQFGVLAPSPGLTIKRIITY